jgi:hypothetical protein
MLLLALLLLLRCFWFLREKNIYISLKLGDKKRRCINLYKYIVGKIYIGKESKDRKNDDEGIEGYGKERKYQEGSGE